MVTVMRPTRARCVKGTIPRQERAVFMLKVGRMLVASTATPAASFGEHRHRGLARRIVAVRWRAAVMIHACDNLPENAGSGASKLPTALAVLKDRC
jgi:hypothetical protein